MIRLTGLPEGTSPKTPVVDTFTFWVREGLPPKYAEAAIVNRDNDPTGRTKKYSSTLTAISSGFLWRQTPEGREFWHRVWLHLRNGQTPLPPLERRD